LDVALAQLVAGGRADGEALAVDVETEDGGWALSASAQAGQRADCITVERGRCWSACDRAARKPSIKQESEGFIWRDGRGGTATCESLGRDLGQMTREGLESRERSIYWSEAG